MKNNNLGMIVIVGKSGSGKTSVAHELQKYGYQILITDTTRPMREGEKNGVDYYFRNQQEFNKLKEEGYYAETVSYNAAFGYCSYGSKKDYYIGNNDNKIIILNPYGLKQVEKLNNKKYTSFYLNVPDDVLLNRLDKRGDDKKEVHRRLKTDREDFKDIDKIVSCVININDKDSIKDIANQIILNLKNKNEI